MLDEQYRQLFILLGAVVVCNVYYTYLISSGIKIGMDKIIYMIAMIAIPLITITLVYNVKVLIPREEIKYKLFTCDTCFITLSLIGTLLYIVV